MNNRLVSSGRQARQPDGLLRAAKLITWLAACWSVNACGGNDSALNGLTAANASVATNTDAGKNSAVAETMDPTVLAQASSADTSAGAAKPGVSIDDLQARVLALVNQARAAGATCGTEPMESVGTLHWQEQIAAAALAHSRYMKESGNFSHVGEDDSTAADRLSATGYQWTVVGENIAAGFRDPQSVMTGWMRSSGHCRNIMNPRFTEMGVVLVDANPDVGFNTYWTMVLAAPRTVAASR